MLIRARCLRCWPALGFLGLMFLVEPGRPLAAPAADPAYVVRSWRTEDGLPESSVSSVVQSRAGYLWVGTYNGLARFDGIRFTVFDPSRTPS
jgi:ligand-binding sensor domain-containing protein